MNGLVHHFHLDESTFFLRGIRSDFPRWASHLRLCRLPMSHKKDAMLKQLTTARVDLTLIKTSVIMGYFEFKIPQKFHAQLSLA